MPTLTSGSPPVNFMMEEGDDRIRATYGKNYARPAKIKKRYDPKNVPGESEHQAKDVA